MENQVNIIQEFYFFRKKEPLLKKLVQVEKYFEKALSKTHNISAEVAKAVESKLNDAHSILRLKDDQSDADLEKAAELIKTSHKILKSEY